MTGAAVLRAPMRARDRPDVPAGTGAAFGLRHGVVGIGGTLDPPPADLDDALARAPTLRARRQLERFADVPEGAFLWTRDPNGHSWLGRVTGPWRYETSAAARACGIHHVRSATWADRPVPDPDVPAAVRRSFDRGGLNLQRIREADVRSVAALWRVIAPGV